MVLLHLLLFWAAPAWPADTGGPIFRDLCTSIPAPVTSKVLCWEQTTQTLRYWNGVAWVVITGASVGVTSVAGTPNQINATPATGPVVLSLPSEVIAPGTVQGALRDNGGQVTNIQAYGVLPTNTATVNSANLIALLAASPLGARYYAPLGRYPILGNILFPVAVTFEGASMVGTIFEVDASVGATTDIFVVEPAAASSYVGYEFRNFTIRPATGTPGRHAIYLSGAHSNIQQLVLDRIKLAQLGGNSIYADGSGLAQGVPSLSIIQNSWMFAGIKLVNSGDTVQIVGNHLTGVGPALDVSFVGGTSSLHFERNVVYASGGVHVGGTAGNALFVEVADNFFEPSGSTGSNGAMVDLDGSATWHVLEAVITRNTFQPTGLTIDGVRVNYADRVYIGGRNRFTRGAGASKDIRITANATGTVLGDNAYSSGGSLAAIVEDLGTGTVQAGVLPDGNFTVRTSAAFTGIALDGSNNPNYLLSNAGTVKARVGLATSGNAFTTGDVANDLVVRTESTAQKIFLTTSAAGAPTLTANNGKVGVNTAAPTGTLSLGGSDPTISSDTADGADLRRLLLTGGGAAGDTRGALLQLGGNENASLGGGSVILDTGSTANAYIRLRTSTSGTGAQTEAMYAKNGLVGFGTLAPAYNVDSAGDVNAAGIYRVATAALNFSHLAGSATNAQTTAVSTNTASAIVARDGSGNFAAGTITASLTGNASTVTTNANLTGPVTSVGNATSVTANAITIAMLATATGLTSAAVGDLLYASATTPTWSRLADVAVGSYLRSGGVNTAPLWSTLVLPNAAVAGDTVIATATNTWGAVTAVGAGSHFRSAGTGTAPVWSTTTWPNSATTGDLLYASATSVYSNLAAVATGSVLASAGTGTAPAWTGTPTFSTSITTPKIVLNTTTNQILGTSADAADNQGFQICPAGACGSGRSALIQFFGNEYGSGVGGVAVIDGGNVTGGGVWLRGDGNTKHLQIAVDGSVTVGATAPATPLVGALYFTGVAFASLGTPSNNHLVICTNCTVANPCAGGGTGALAKRLNGVWVCN